MADAYNPLEKLHLARSVAEALLTSAAHELPLADSFRGAGLYAIYYLGDFPLYAPISEANRENRFEMPIYVGKAVPEGARKGLLGFGADVGPVLFRRLNEHAESIRLASNLRVEDFRARHLVVDDIWIPLGESLLIRTFGPLWNAVIDGFGNHDPGSGRYNQKCSPWDTLHPGRQWATRLQPCSKEYPMIQEEVAKYFAGRSPRG